MVVAVGVAVVGGVDLAAVFIQVASLVLVVAFMVGVVVVACVLGHSARWGGHVSGNCSDASRRD